MSIDIGYRYIVKEDLVCLKDIVRSIFKYIQYRYVYVFIYMYVFSIKHIDIGYRYVFIFTISILYIVLSSCSLVLV